MISTDPQIRFHSRDGTPWDLGHGLAAVGPGWWPLVRAAFAEAETEGAIVAQVRQKACVLDVLVHPHPRGYEAAAEIRVGYQRLSACVCEACGGPAVPVADRPTRETRTHCDPCAARWAELRWDERALWMERAGGAWLPEWY